MDRSNSDVGNEELIDYEGTLQAIRDEIRNIHRETSNDDMNPSVAVLGALADVPVDLEDVREEELSDQAILEAHEQAQLPGEIYVMYYTCKCSIM